MNLIMWNCQGLGGPSTIKNLESLIWVHRPSLVFISETKCSSYRISCLHYRLNMHGVGVDSRGRSGGLALFWDKSVSCVLRSFSLHHIDVIVQADDDSSPWRFTGFYGEPNTSKRKSSWELLTSFAAQSPCA
ncbi:UNVERIFIED_CONTAM: hypothetical protein Scaly_1739000 [Sesamum calycinum]|uniref:Endonuclease/exonuclease/phosphatase n=1 Tax=Sesamum calycinum TaxID=2727403 RepID=A0AAW2NWD0_9LAMI